MSEVLLSQLAHVEIVSPKPQESVDWFVDVLGLELTERRGQSAYLRAWGEWFHSSLIVTEGPGPALAHVGWRTYGPGDLEVIARHVDPDLAIGWSDASPGHGRAFRFRAPMGHIHEVFWDVERYQAPPELRTDMRSRPQRYTARGAAARYVDHVTINAPALALADEVDWYRSVLGSRHTGSIMPEPGHPMFATLTCNAIRSSHDLALVPDAPHARGRVNHIAYRVDQKLDFERAADVFIANDTPIEFGPGIHGMDEIQYLYVREPGGVRIELNSGGWQNYQPDWAAPEHLPHEGPTTYFRNLKMPDSMMESFPPLETSREVFQAIGQFAER